MTKITVLAMHTNSSARTKHPYDKPKQVIP